jgi:hypothetical protein
VLVDDRSASARATPLVGGGLPPVPVPAALAGRIRVLPGRCAGPGAARSDGWRATSAWWVAFLDDDVVPTYGWRAQLAADLTSAPADLGGSQGRITVPLPVGRRATDWERNVSGLEHARWATADLAYRRAALESAGGFDERFRRAYREDTDLGLRLVRAGWRVELGRRSVLHPVRPAGPATSVRLQAGNADDVLAFALHGPGWRQAGGVPSGRRPRHLALTAAGAAGLACLVLGRRRLAAVGIAGWLAGTAELAWARIAPGPRTPAEVTTMVWTSAVLPAAATWHSLAGLVRHRRELLARCRGVAAP